MSQKPTCLLSTSETAQLLGVSIRTLEGWRFRGGGPRYVKAGGRMVRYRLSDLDEWVDAQVRRSTSDLGPGAR